MGLETNCRAVMNGRSSVGAAHCGDGEIDFKGDFRFRWKWSELDSVTESGGVARFVRGPDKVELHLGELASKWIEQIKNPKNRIDKLGLKPVHRYAAVGDFDEKFCSELEARAGGPSDGELDALFVRLDSFDDFDLLLQARQRMVPNGMIWAVWPKGRRELREDDIRNFALANGLVDVKVVSFSDHLSALKLVIPVALRSQAAK